MKHELYRKINRPHFASRHSPATNGCGERKSGRYRATICENVGKVMLTFVLLSWYRNISDGQFPAGDLRPTIVRRRISRSERNVLAWEYFKDSFNFRGRIRATYCSSSGPA